MFKQFNSLGTEKLIPENTDIIPIQEASGMTRHIKRVNFISGIANTNELIQLQDSRANGTVGGSATAGSWNKRTINTIAVDEIGTTVLSSNVFTIDEGTYDIDALSQFYKGNFIKTRLFDVTANSVIITSINNYNSAEACSFSHLKGRFTIASRKSLSIEYRVSLNTGTTALGEPCNFGQNEIYLLANLWKVS
jgi:hypothetical protein